MAALELLAVVVLFLVGYWLVSALWTKLPRGRDAPAPTGAPTGEGWHQVLGVAPDATADEIERAYRARLEQYGPEKVAELGPEVQAVARQMTERINAAYAQALAARR
jgi:DnaJ like chaperone protein